MKLLDRIYFTIKNAINPITYDEAYDDGVLAGIEIANARIAEELKAKYPYDLKNQAFRLGYEHAVAVAKGEVK
jgi:hypothetical protein